MTEYVSQINTPNGRFYKIGDNSYMSVTTFLSKVTDKSSLAYWKAHTVDHEATTKQSSDRGEYLHEICEKYGKNIPFNLDDYPVIVQKMWKCIKLSIDKYCKKIIISEGYLFSHSLKLAGSVDNVSIDHDGNIIIIDYKNSRKTKKSEHIISYYLQIAYYAIMFMEMYGKTVKGGVILIVNPLSTKPQEFNVDLDKWIPIALAIKYAYDRMNGDI